MSTTTHPAAHPLLSPELKAFILEWKARPGCLIMVLHRVQQSFGYVPRAAAFEVAELLEVPLAKIYGVITFYNFFKLSKPGRNRIQVCMGTACYLRGGEDIIREIEGHLGVGLNAVTPDGEFSFEAVRCLGCCGLAPVMVINGEVYGKLESSQLPGILAKYRDPAAGGRKPEAGAAAKERK
ncbi:MAG: NAD(P)H-dependent oxidoreductase subunit E [bacterium]